MLDAQKLLIFFDFDGVIVQTFDVSYDMISHEYEGMSREEYRSYFEGNYYAEEEKRLGKHRVLNPISRKTWFEKWCVRILEKPIISGIDTVIKELAGSFDLEIVSGSAEFCIEAYLKQVGLREYFSEILGPEVAKSKVEKFTLAC
jgi:beta-phosphoglucomutase-like phosphatase (HAD superfamily)